VLILSALVAVYLVLGILYESLVHPLTILSTLPSAGVGALLALLATGQDFTIIALIGVILLIGIVKKNAIMMIDFALQIERERDCTAREAIYEACLLRLRPILMTTMAAMFGALPLAIGTGDGAELRRPLGIAVVGGLFLSQLLTLYTTPVMYVYLDRFRLWAKSPPAALLEPARRAAPGRPRQGARGRAEGLVSSAPRRRAVWRALPLVALATVAGCQYLSVGPVYHRPSIEVPQDYKEAGDWKPAEPQDAKPRGNWWDLYDDPDLDALMRQVAVSNQSVRLAAARYEQAVALLGNARSATSPPSPPTSPPRAARTLSPSAVVAPAPLPPARRRRARAPLPRIGRAPP